MAFVIIYLLCLSGSALAAALGGKRPAAALAVTPIAAALVVYAGALLGALRAGAYAAYALAAACWLASGAILLRRGNAAEAARLFFSPAWLIFTLLFAFFAWGSRGMQVHTWDEFSHWAYAVQEMRLSGQLYTAAGSDAWFKSYPPLMPLWQYLCQTARGGTGTDGSLLYFGSSLAGACLLTPFLSRLRWKRPLTGILSALAALALPVLAFGADALQLVYIDAFLGLLAGVVFALIAVGAYKKPLGCACLTLMEAALTLTKDAGLAFAGISLIYLLFCLLSEKGGKRRFMPLLLAGLAVIVAKGSWSLHLRALGLAADGLRVDWADLGRLLTGAAQDSYRLKVLRTFGQFLLYDDTLRATAFKWPVSYFLALVLLTAAGYPACGRRCGLRLTAFLALMSAVYLGGLLLLYLYHFGAYNGLHMTSGARYVKTLILCLVTVVCVLALHGAGGARPRAAALALLAACLLLTPWGDLAAYADGRLARQTAVQAAPYQEAAAQTAKMTGGTTDARACVYVLLQKDRDLDYYGLRYYLRPCARVNENGWHLADARLAEDYNTWDIAPDEWAKALADYDAVYVSQADDYLRQRYGHLFVGDIADGTLWRVTPQAEGVLLTAP